MRTSETVRDYDYGTERDDEHAECLRGDCEMSVGMAAVAAE